jgi:hypothetical protein
MALVPLTLDLIEEGRFLRDLEAELARLQAELIMYRQTFCAEAGGAKGTLVATITIVSDKEDEHAFAIRTGMKRVMPLRPSQMTIALDDAHPVTGAPVLVVRDSGSDLLDPRQGKMFTDEGKPTEPTEEGKPTE